MAEIAQKKWYQSSTIWINVAGIVAIVLDYMIKSGSVLDPDVIAIILAVINIIRRFTAPVKIESIEKSVI